MSQIEQIANGVRAFADDVNGPSAAARQLNAGIRQLADASARLEGPEASQARAAIESAAASALAVSGSLESFRANAHAFADRLARGGGNGTAFAQVLATPTATHAAQDASLSAADRDPELLGSHRYQPTSGQLFGKLIGGDVPMQGEVGDCYLIASISAVAATEPATLRAAFDMTEGDLKFHGVSVGDQVPDKGASSSDGSDWVALIEKAYASERNGYQGIQGGVAADALHWLTGRPSSITLTTEMSDLQLASMCRSAVPSVSSSLAPASARAPEIQSMLDAYGVFAGHAYTLTGLDSLGRVTLRNPWGFDHPDPMPIEVFRQIFWRHCSA